MKLVHWPLMGGLLHLIQREGAWAGSQPAQAPRRCNGNGKQRVNKRSIEHLTLRHTEQNKAINQKRTPDFLPRSATLERDLCRPSVCLSQAGIIRI